MAESSFSSGLMPPVPATSPSAPEGNLPQRDLQGKPRRREPVAKDASSLDNEDLVQDAEHELDRLA